MNQSWHAVKSRVHPEPRFVEFWLGSEQLKIDRIDPKIDEFADLHLQLMPDFRTGSLVDAAESIGDFSRSIAVGKLQSRRFAGTRRF